MNSACAPASSGDAQPRRATRRHATSRRAEPSVVLPRPSVVWVSGCAGWDAPSPALRPPEGGRAASDVVDHFVIRSVRSRAAEPLEGRFALHDRKKSVSALARKPDRESCATRSVTPGSPTSASPQRHHSTSSSRHAPTPHNCLSCIRPIAIAQCRRSGTGSSRRSGAHVLRHPAVLFCARRSLAEASHSILCASAAVGSHIARGRSGIRRVRRRLFRRRAVVWC